MVLLLVYARLLTANQNSHVVPHGEHTHISHSSPFKSSNPLLYPMILGYDEYSHKLSHTYHDIDLRFSKFVISNTLNVKFSTIKEREGGTKILTPLLTFLKLSATQGHKTVTSASRTDARSTAPAARLCYTLQCVTYCIRIDTCP